jgi:hypothetical protein
MNSVSKKWCRGNREVTTSKWMICKSDRKLDIMNKREERKNGEIIISIASSFIMMRRPQ